MSACTPNCPVMEPDHLSETEMEACAAYCKMKAALRHFFRFDSFRPGQIAALLPVLHGKDVAICQNGDRFWKVSLLSPGPTGSWPFRCWHHYQSVKSLDGPAGSFS